MVIELRLAQGVKESAMMARADVRYNIFRIEDIFNH
jgi:hypothetical protein